MENIKNWFSFNEGLFHDEKNDKNNKYAVMSAEDKELVNNILKKMRSVEDIKLSFKTGIRTKSPVLSLDNKHVCIYRYSEPVSIELYVDGIEENSGLKIKLDKPSFDSLMNIVNELQNKKEIGEEQYKNNYQNDIRKKFME